MSAPSDKKPRRRRLGHPQMAGHQRGFRRLGLAAHLAPLGRVGWRMEEGPGVEKCRVGVGAFGCCHSVPWPLRRYTGVKGGRRGAGGQDKGASALLRPASSHLSYTHRNPSTLSRDESPSFPVLVSALAGRGREPSLRRTEINRRALLHTCKCGPPHPSSHRGTCSRGFARGLSSMSQAGLPAEEPAFSTRLPLSSNA